MQRDRGSTFPVLPVSTDSAPARQHRLRLRSHLTQDEQDAAHAARSVRLNFADKLANVENRETDEGYLSALTPALYNVLLSFAQRRRPPPRMHRRPQDPARELVRRRPPRTPRNERLNEALDHLETL
ncbi:hypothetical protein PR001_g1107 [Phytophthora rubi]|uniref:Uncharacterized protein n=1 Tax=Phytophthora rubi TaxID=129364 RepID=A0A6A3P452_9STRA|nr:hypothetical protein PR002_g967 [Phytophthora rubi]KAE9051773.1 hypothetical protein PR001_g1107 [Phytophthora rubi]